MDFVFGFLDEQPILYAFLLVGIGALVGRLRIGGVSLGAVAVLFAAIGITAWGVTAGYTVELPDVLGNTGLVLFAFATGIIAGPGFFNAIATAWPLILSVSLVLVAAAASAAGAGLLLGLDAVTIAGTFAGALTNTPALAATGGSPAATVGYASAYVFGVIGAMLFAALALRSRKSDKDAPVPIVDVTVRVETSSIPTVGELSARHGSQIVFSRLRQKGDDHIETVDPDTPIPPGSVVTVVGPEDEIDSLISEIGHPSSMDLKAHRDELDFRRITLSDAHLAGRTVASLQLRAKFGATVARVRRGDVELVSSPGLVLQLGDRLRVVAPTASMEKVTSFLGDSTRGLTDINPVALGLGIAIGLVLGSVHVPLPDGSSFAIGPAAGALIMGLIMGRVGRIGPIVTSLPYVASSVLAELGLLLFLAFAGTKAGSLIVSAIVSGKVLGLLLLGAIVTLVGMGATFLVVKYIFRTGGTRLSGVIGGAQTNPAILAFANSRTGYDARVALGYSLVYPAAMVVKILLAQVLVDLPFH